MQKCPYNKSIDCDAKYRDSEERRQMAVALRSGAFWFNKSHCGCMAHSWQCPRLTQRQR
ncbi:MAG: hypothetical protein NC311_02105 [Muribaculaceae bacterium]|nr:hypothetical protein [Muribaculaceae bacterium]